MNIGIIHAQGEIVLRADAHTLYAHDYVTKCIRTLTESGAANVGGVITPMGEDLKSETIAIAVSSPFGVGNAYYRYANREMFVDTLAFGCWRKSTLVKMGGYREDYLANEDYELNYRLRCAGGKILLSPDIKSYYYSRGSLKALFKQYFRYGKWKVKTLSEHPRSLVFRQVVAPIFVASLLASVCLVPLTHVPLIVVGGSYTLANLAFSSRIAWKRGFRYLLVLPQAFFTIHFAWGMGFLNGIRTFVKLKDLRTSGSHCQPHSPHVRKGSLRLQEIEG
jgi:GT2 family glycosyltransferase